MLSAVDRPQQRGLICGTAGVIMLQCFIRLTLKRENIAQREEHD